MPIPLVECVPNFSEARRPQVVEAIVDSIRSIAGVRVLDRHSDLDHNRSVVTFAGPPQAVEEAAFRGIARAAELIDLNVHTGEHPRIGAADVVPFVPISGVTMQDCVEMARRLGRRVGEELGIPVFLYERAATRPERQNLEDIRRGEYEALKEEIAIDPARAPDFGPARLGPAGACVIGARPFLIAFNVYLTTDDVSIAEKVARAIRHSSGGLRYVKALGMLVEGRAQVSMNLTDYRKTPVARVVELIRREAARYGVGVHHSELVGLIPQEALVDVAVWHLQLDQFRPEQVLEGRLYEAFGGPAAAEQVAPASLAEKERNFLEALAAPTPTPGGGSASAAAGAAAAALVAMVARLTIGKKKYADVEARMRSIVDQAEALRASLIAAVEEDAAAFEGVLKAGRLPKDNPEQQATRAAALQAASLEAARTPLRVATMAVQVLELAGQVIAHGNLAAICDGGSAAALAQAALTGAALNVRINLAGLRDLPEAGHMLARLKALEGAASSLQEQARTWLIERGGLVQE